MKPNVTSMRMFFVAGILRSIYSVGLGPTLWLMGAIQVNDDDWHWKFNRLFAFYFQVLNKGVFLVSFMGNNGTFSKSRYENLSNFELVYHVGYLLLCVLGLCLHEFFYSLLVRIRWFDRSFCVLMFNVVNAFISYSMLSIVKIRCGMSFNVLYAMLNQLFWLLYSPSSSSICLQSAVIYSSKMIF